MEYAEYKEIGYVFCFKFICITFKYDRKKNFFKLGITIRSIINEVIKLNETI